jgi:DNA-binding LacI/PurR family transcriptional regulator
MIAQKADAIVLAPADSKALVSACKRALDAGIVVVNIDNRLDAGVLAERGLKIPFVGPDNRKGARLVGEYLARKLPAGAPVAILEGVPTAFNAQQRRLGFEDAIKAAGLKLVASQSGDWEMAKANQSRPRCWRTSRDPGAALRQRQHGPGRGGGAKGRRPRGKPRDRGLRQHQRGGRPRARGQGGRHR